MKVSELVTALSKIQQTFPNAVVAVEGWNDMGDLMQFELRGDIRLERDGVGNPMIVLR
jgi:hypothetical protein